MAVHDESHPSFRHREPASVEEAARRRMNFSPWNLLLVLPLVGTLLPAIYNKQDPTLGGWPFFYWYQMIAIPVSVGITIIVYRATRGER